MLQALERTAGSGVLGCSQGGLCSNQGRGGEVDYPRVLEYEGNLQAVGLKFQRILDQDGKDLGGGSQR